MNQPEELNTEFEIKLMEAMRAVDPPTGFADRILAQSQPTQPSRAKIFVMPRSRNWASGAIAAALLAGVVLGEQMHLRHQREEAALAQRQFEAAMRITDHTLEHTREQLQRAGIQFGE